MALIKYKLGDLITVVDERNDLGIRDFCGININKEFMPTVANTEGLDETKYKVIRENRFVFSGMQTGRDVCIRISMYTKSEPILVSPAYTTFEVTATDVVLPMYFFLCFLSHEKDRLGAFLSDGSIRSNLDWPVFCDIELELPPLPIQQKYVNVYNAMLANQQCYERGLEDLKLVCDAYIEDLRRNMPCEPIGPYIFSYDLKAKDSQMEYSIDDIAGVSSVYKKFIETKANTDGLSIDNYNVVPERYFSFNPNTARMGDKLPIALNDSGKELLVSAIYPVFGCLEGELIPEYLAMFFARTQFDRYARFHSWGSARETFDWIDMVEVMIPIPSIEIQKDIVDIYNAYITRKDINEKLKSQIKDLCPILIKGSIEEAKNSKEA